MSTADNAVAGLTVLDGAAYSARGERTRMRLGNGVEVRHTFDPETFRTSRITARRDVGAAVQDCWTCSRPPTARWVVPAPSCPAASADAWAVRACVAAET